MRSHRVIHRLKWIGTIGCVVVAALFVLSLWYTLTLSWTERDYSIAFGAVCVITSDYPYRTVDFRIRRRQTRPLRQYDRWLRYVQWLPAVHQQQGIRDVRLPLWIPFFVLGVPTAYLWRKDKPYPPATQLSDANQLPT